MADVQKYIKPSYRFTEINEMQKLPLEVKEQISIEIIRQAISLSKHKIAIAFSGGKDSQVVADLFERNFPEDFKNVYGIFGNTGIEFPESLKFAREYGKEHFGYREQLFKLFKIKRNNNIYDAFTDDSMKQRVIERFGDSSRLFDAKPCAYDDFGELVEL